VPRAKPEHRLPLAVRPVERRHHARERAGRGAVDPPDPIPEQALTDPFEKTELEEEAVHPDPGAHEREIARAHRIYCAGVDEAAPRRGMLDVLDEELLEDEELW